MQPIPNDTIVPAFIANGRAADTEATKGAMVMLLFPNQFDGDCDEIAGLAAATTLVARTAFRGADTICCRLNKKDVLMLKIERPAWSMPIVQEVVNPLGSSCPCGTGGTSMNHRHRRLRHCCGHPCPVRHWEFDNELGGYTWFTENGSSVSEAATSTGV